MKKRGRTPVPQETIEKVVKEYVETDQGIFEVCKKYGVSYSKINQTPEYREIMYGTAKSKSRD